MDLFLPNPARARQIDASVRLEVAGALAAISDALSPSMPDSAAAIGRLIEGLGSGPVRPAVVAIYSDLVLAVSHGDEAALRASLASAAGLDEVASPAPFRAVTLDDALLGPGMAASYVRHADDDPAVALDIVGVASERLDRATVALGSVVSRIASADPALGGELSALVREVVFAENGGRAPGFDGATAFYLWGASVLNVELADDPRRLAEALVHEAAHTRLLGETSGRPLVDNPADERFASPLRPDPRPMEGIVHANYVVARLHYLAGRLFSGEHRATRLAENRALFEASDETVMAHARFTPEGARIYAAARDYMRAAGD